MVLLCRDEHNSFVKQQTLICGSSFLASFSFPSFEATVSVDEANVLITSSMLLFIVDWILMGLKRSFRRPEHTGNDLIG